MSLNSLSRDVSDKLSHKLANTISVNSDMRDRLVDGIYHSKAYTDIQNALKLHESSQSSVKKVKAAVRAKKLPKKNVYILLDEALKLGIITEDEKNILQEAKKAKESVVQVDGFKVEDYLSRKV